MFPLSLILRATAGSLWGKNEIRNKRTSSFITMIVSLTPLFVSLLSFPILGERLKIIQLIGGVFIISSGFLAEKMKM
ncbi:EamA family transporter [Candidatus Gottesmanbacteria bacterium]|nr:EamA family transporter [Candidatus Gottesmanbacteria bacterium]